MDYEKAKKAVQAKKPRENYLLVEFDYTQLVLPHKVGMAFIDAIGSAEVLDKPYNRPYRIQELERGKFKVTTMSAEEYDRHKIAALLGVSIDDVREFENAPTS